MAEGDTSMKEGDFKWSAIVLTCPEKKTAQVIQNELRLRQQHGSLAESSVVLCVEDPHSCVGSGGATLNALLVITEHISARHGHTVVNFDVLQKAHVLIVHVGRDFVFDPCTRAFVSVAVSEKGVDFPVSNVDLLIDTVTQQLASRSPPGVWVCSTDMFLHLNDAPSISFEGVDAVAVSVLASKSYAAQHGVFKVNSQNFVEDIIFRGSESTLSRCCVVDDQVALVSGVVYMSVLLAEKLLSLHVTPPLDACTYIGLDSGAQPIQLSLFFDMLLAMCDGVSEEEYVSGEKGTTYVKHLMAATTTGDNNEAAAILEQRRKARMLLWKELHSLKLRVWPVPDGSHCYMNLQASLHHKHLMRMPAPSSSRYIEDNRAGSYAAPGATVHESSILLNSMVADGASVGEKTILSHTYLSVPCTVGKDSMFNGVYTIGLEPGTVFTDSLVVQTFHINLPTLNVNRPILTVLGKFDDLQGSISSRGSSMCNNPWQVFFGLTGITQEDLWDSSVSDYEKCLLNAKLYPVLHTQHEVGWREIILLQGTMDDQAEKEEVLKRWRSSWRLSLEEILKLVDPAVEFSWRRKLQYEHIAPALVRDTLINGQDRGLTQLYKRAVVDGYAVGLLSTLDSVASTCGSAGIAARCLANIANVLGAMAGGQGGLRSGPAANKEWAQAFQLLEEERISEGVAEMACVRAQWLDRPEKLVRAARHYEGATQILIRRAVLTARQFISTRQGVSMPGLGLWVTAECPARLDIAGGWSDTPPITYEHGGAVLDAAIMVDGLKPIGSKARRIEEPVLKLVMGDVTLTLTVLEQLADYNQPHSPGALLKAAFVCAEIVEYPSSISLAQQLKTRYSGGFELHTWSNLPHGSGLGTSSILAGAVMAALWKASGRTFDIHSLNHAVLQLEQMLTTGGGWQDQVGGLTGGIKLGISPAQLPLHVDIVYPTISPQTVQEFSERLLLVYTGKTRLARNLLQNVLRTWYARDPEIVATEDGLVETAHRCADAFTAGNIEEVGACMNHYWELKKRMAPGCEPVQVLHMREALAMHTYGTCMAGAGGGGFLYVLCKRPHSETLVRTLLKNIEGCDDATVHEASVDNAGMVLTVEGEDSPVHVPLNFDEEEDE